MIGTESKVTTLLTPPIESLNWPDPADSDPSLVHNEETSVRFASIPPYGAFLRRFCAAEYAAVFRTYSILDGSRDNGMASRLRDCRLNAWFTRNIDTGEVRVASSACHLRWCPVCLSKSRNYVTHEVSEWLKSADHPKLITLTLKHAQDPLDHQVKRLYDSFRKLRNRKDFKQPVTGGIWWFQIKKSKSDGMWHPHIHALVTGQYLPRRRLSRMWTQITCDSTVTEIRAIHDSEKVANDVARYATCPGSLVDLPPDDAIEMVESLHGRRICGKWGTARGVSLRPNTFTDKGKWKAIGSWSVVTSLAKTDSAAKAILLSWKTGAPLSEGITCNRIDEAINNLEDPSWTDCESGVIDTKARDPPFVDLRAQGTLWV